MTEVRVVGGMTMNGWMDGSLVPRHVYDVSPLHFVGRKSNLLYVSTT